MKRGWIVAVAVGVAVALAELRPPAEAEIPDAVADLRAAPRAAAAPAPAVVHRATPRETRRDTVAIPTVDPVPEPVLDDDEARARVAAADAAFEAGDLEAATIAFADVVDNAPDSALAPYAAYKLAWCERNGGRLDEAIAEMERAAHWAAPTADGELIVAEAGKDLEKWKAERLEASGTDFPVAVPTGER